MKPFKHVFSENFGPKKCHKKKLEHFRFDQKKRKSKKKYPKKMQKLGDLKMTTAPCTIRWDRKPGIVLFNSVRV